ncbi:hypothetical protein L3Q82_010692, partial [Scortum barcoo]
MAGKGNPVPGPHLNGFPMPTYSYFFPHMLGSLSPPALPGLPISGYSTPSPASLSDCGHALTGSDGVSVLTFYLLEFALAVSVEGSEEQLVPGPVTPTSPIPDTPPHSQRLELLSDSSFSLCC